MDSFICKGGINKIVVCRFFTSKPLKKGAAQVTLWLNREIPPPSLCDTSPNREELFSVDFLPLKREAARVTIWLNRKISPPSLCDTSPNREELFSVDFLPSRQRGASARLYLFILILQQRNTKFALQNR